MKLFLISPNIKALLSEKQMSQLNDVSEVILHSDITPFEQIPGLLEGNEERILAIDPDFCDWKVPNKIIDKIPQLKAIVLQTTSFSWIDVDFAEKKGIPVMNLRGFSSIAVAEWATMMMLALARKLPIIIKDSWKQDYIAHQGIELRGKTAGVIGIGNIGTAVAENCHGLGMNVQYWSKSSKDDRFKRVELEELLKTSDVIIPCVAQNDETQGMLTDDMLKSMKKTAMFVSDVHAVYNHDLLLEMVKNGNLYGYAFEDGKAKMENFEGNVWAGPELAWCTEDSMRKNAEQWVEAIVNACNGEYLTQVN
ncbi:MAG: hypothetical protein COU63_00265 [Candidatus Pacebacteria bacterium CG10_big_fil_rev_8_21_14_0_10_36_11]|nr:hypothetical protein [Candidatus Pacearchaeota archaeon]OIP74190.1 MAG: hypothetical protein AUK08_03015 [Candidatus Pacebacteria bacterium CG2_30_36_39]PIR65093.1 MAG: hypothetical protein COU63_00265 [Candidatus Pacebacteria bacterium CG10_big_fil_rev_8_21_14_0_10_36_11]PJC42407.1 MAG: hypothetical protein CO040_04565 [Candidatus Pacebacteria bacterium CG_4_9_14_0_2_um_filter_36_8]